MRITFDLPKPILAKIIQDQRRIGLSRSDILRQILKRHYEQRDTLKVVGLV